MQSFERKSDVIITGGGVAGLTAAALLARRGKDVRLIEQSHAVGGRARTKQQNGFYLNQGPHALYRAGRGIEILRELGIEPRGRVPAISGAFAVRDGVKQTLPTGFVSLLTTNLLGPGAKLEMGRLLSSIGKLDGAEVMRVSLADWVDENISHEEVKGLFYALCRVSTYTNAPEIMSAGAAIEQLKLASDKSVLYLDGGWQTIVDGLGEAAINAGVKIETGVKIKSIERDQTGAVRAVRTDDGRNLETDAVIMASSPKVAASLIEGGNDTSLAKWAAEAVPVKAACLDIALDRLPDPKATFALGIDRPHYLSVHSATARLAPEGGALIQLAKYLPPDDPSPESAERELETLMDLVQSGWRKAVVYRRFLPDMVVMNAIATAEQGGTVGRPSAQVEDVPGLFIAGDWVGSEGLLVDASLASAKEAAELIVRLEPARLRAAV